MGRKYPNISSIDRVKPQGLCVICKQPKANARLTVEHNIFRGDDSVLKVHSQCVTGPKEDVLQKLPINNDEPMADSDFASWQDDPGYW